MGDVMPKEQYDYIKKIQDECLEATNMTEDEAWSFGFRCWQLNYGKLPNKINAKYEILTDDAIIHEGVILYRIKALKDFGNVKKNELGGYVETEYNLSQAGKCWIYPNAKVYNTARIDCNATINDQSEVYGDAWISDNAKVCGMSKVYGKATICSDVWIINAEISNHAVITHDKDYCTIHGFGSEYRTTTFFKIFRTKDDIYVNSGCFHGTLEEFKRKVQENHSDDEFGKEYNILIELIKNKLKD